MMLAWLSIYQLRWLGFRMAHLDVEVRDSYLLGGLTEIPEGEQEGLQDALHAVARQPWM